MVLTRDNMKAVAALLKKRFPNLTVEETLDLAGEIIEALRPVGDPRE